MWRALSHAELRVWEGLEQVQQKRYFNEVRARALWDESHGHGEEGEVLPRGERAVLSWGREASLPRPAQRGATAGLGWPFAHQRSRRAVRLPVWGQGVAAMHKADRRLTVTDTWQDRGEEEEKEEDDEEEEEDGESGEGAQLKRELRELARYQVRPRVRGA